MAFRRKKKINSLSKDSKKMIVKSNSFFNWIQEYSKKIISVTFIIYVIINLYCLIMTLYVFHITREFQSLDTLIIEMNTTFRDVVGGYIIKAAVENVSKYSGAILDKWLEHKLDNEMKTSETDDSVIEERDGLTWKKKK